MDGNNPIKSKQSMIDSSLLSIILDNYPSGSITLVDSNLTVQYTSGERYSDFNLDPEKFIGQSLEEFLQEEQYHAIVNYLPELKSGNKKEYISNYEGSQFKMILKPIMKATHMEHLLIIADDITYQLLEKDERQVYLGILDISLNEIYMFDEESLKFTYVNKGGQKNLGYTLEELKKLTPVDIKPEFSQKLLEEKLMLLKSGQQDKLNFTTVHQRKNGTTYPVEIYLQLIKKDFLKNTFLAITLDISEKEQQENSLKESKELLDNIANSIPGLVMRYRITPDGNDKIEFVSDGISDLWEIDKEEALKDTSKIWAKVHPDDIPLLQEKIEESAAKMNFWSHQYRAIMEDGRVKWILGKGQPQAANDGSIIWHSIALDVTSYKETELELEKTKKLLNQTSKVANLGGWEYYLKTNEIIWSEETYRICGFPEGEKVGYDEYIECHAKAGFKEAVLTTIENSIKEVKPYEEEWGFVKPDGQFIWLKATGYPFKGDNGEVESFYGAVEDITIKRQNKKDLILLESAIKNTNDSVIITSAESIDLPGPEIIFVNEAFEKMTGYKKEEVMGKSPRILQGPKTDRKELDKLRYCLEKHEFVETEIINYTKSGVPYWVNFSIVPIKTNDHVTHFVSISRDVTKRKNDELEKESVISDLEKINKEMDAFIYRVSHDLRAPISSSLGLIELTKQEKDPVLIKSYLEKQDATLKKLDSFIQDILNYSRNIRIDNDFQKIDVESLTTIILTELKKGVSKEIHTSVKIDGKVPFFSDHFRIEMILNNLISNAIKFTRSDPDKKSFISVSGIADKQELVLQVEDNGMGIMEKHIDRIFDMFYRGTDRNYGSGLGLYIVKDAIEILEGQIKVESEYGKGTKFTLFIPNKYRED